MGIEMEMKMEKRVRNEAIDSITDRLSSLENLYFPRALQQSAITPSQRKTILHDLFHRDVAVFLERYGSHLNSDELLEFDVLNNDYEINWHLKDLRKKMNPTSDELRSRMVIVRNRRLAYLNKLMSEGQYFSEDSMREREPYLHHEYVGKFQDISGRGMARPGERWSETLMRRTEEAILVAKIREEQMRFGVAERDLIGNETNLKEEEQQEEIETSSEEEEEDDVDEAIGGSHINEMISAQDPVATNDAQPTTVGNTGDTIPSLEEMEDLMEQFTYIMQQKFLSGEDEQHLDYSKIDNDETLDDHWVKEVNLDAEEKYFGED